MPDLTCLASHRMPGRVAALLILTLAASPSGFAAGADNEDCLQCHEDPALTGERDGEGISVFVDRRLYGETIHGDLECVMCHQDLGGAELPHEADLAPVDCAACHEEAAELQRRSVHGRAAARGDLLAPSCVECHGKHAIRPRSDPRSPVSVMNVPALCGRCHHEGSPVSMQRDIPQDEIYDNYSESIHGEGLYRRGLTVTAVCTSCHRAHDILPHTDPASSIHRANVAATCTQCHSRIEDVHRKVIGGRLWEEQPHKIPACVDCHSPHRIRQVFYPAGMANADCLRCHSDPALVGTARGESRSLFVDEIAYGRSKHAGTACAQCHTEVTASRERSCETIRSKVDCSICHAAQVDEYSGGIHGKLREQGDPDAPVCLDCHDRHATLGRSDPASPTYPRNVPSLCARCHRIGEKAAVRIQADVPDIVGSYVESIHGKGLLESGLVVTATCASCHTAHRELPPGDPESSVNDGHIASTCGSCHHGIEETFKTSIHWPGNGGEGGPGRPLPTCEDCHSSHTITRTDQPDFRFRMMDQCGRCHEPEASTFFDTFHGKVSRLGSEGAAKCYDCHGTHDILPVENPASRLSRDNVVGTCARCHEGSHRRFAGYLTHATHHDAAKYPYLFWSFWGMTALLVGTLTFAVLHTLAWLVRLWLTRKQWRSHKAAPDGRLYRRFDRRQRTLHLVMMISFFTLALTGMALKFSYMRWAEVLSWLLGGFETMGILHRLGALTLGTVFVLHLRDFARKRREAGVTWWRMVTGPDSIVFNVNDIREALGSIKWFFGWGPRPRYGRYTYWEKFDYFAVLWGIVIIGSTGTLLWFPELFTRVLPGWSVNVATIIHSDEALLAVAFIFTIHFFNTHFRPDKFPMDQGMLTGRVPLEELRYDKPREYEQLVARGELDAHIVQPLPRPVEQGFRILGYTALAVGLTLIALIVYSMLFGYR